MKVKFNNEQEMHDVTSYSIGFSTVTLIRVPENLSGFTLYEDDGETIIKDCSDYIYRWDIYLPIENGATYTNSETDRQPERVLNRQPGQEIIDPLTNEELTECVADLMYEVSMMSLGL